MLADGQARPIGAGQCRRRIGESFGNYTGTRGVDSGLGVDPFAHSQRLLRHLVRGVPDGARLLGAGVRGTQLSKDLRLADDHRVEPCGHKNKCSTPATA